MKLVSFLNCSNALACASCTCSAAIGAFSAVYSTLQQQAVLTAAQLQTSVDLPYAEPAIISTCADRISSQRARPMLCTTYTSRRVDVHTTAQ
jgi:hypothetical protein